MPANTSAIFAGWPAAGVAPVAAMSIGSRVSICTLAMVSLGCTICRGCQLDTCHVGIATQIETTEQAEQHGLKKFTPQVLPGEGVLTAYFAPEYQARRRPDDEFSAPVRARPADLVQNGGAINVNGQFLVPDHGDGTTLASYTMTGAGASLSVNDWLAVGRGGAAGTLTISNGAITKIGGSGSHLDVGAGGVGVFNQEGGAVTNITSDTWIGESSDGTYNLGQFRTEAWPRSGVFRVAPEFL